VISRSGVGIYTNCYTLTFTFLFRFLSPARESVITVAPLMVLSGKKFRGYTRRNKFFQSIVVHGTARLAHYKRHLLRILLAHHDNSGVKRSYGSLNCFSCRDLDISPMTLKLEGDLDNLKMYLHTENEVAKLKRWKLLAVEEMCIANEKNIQD